MRALKVLAVYLLGPCLLGANASAASGQALTLYDEGKPVPDGAKMYVEVKTDLCANYSQPEVWNFAARMMANGAETVTVKIKSPKRAECNYSSLYPAPRVAKFKGIQLVDNGTATVIGVMSWRTEEREHPFCEYRFHNTIGQFLVPGEAKIEGGSVGSATPAKNCPSSSPTLEQKMVVIVRGSSGHILESRRA